MKVLITGSSGQLGKALIEKIPKNIEIYAPKRSELNLSDIKSCKDIIKRLKPDWTINCGAFTNVNLAESQKEIAMRINAGAPEAFAKEIKNYGGSLLQISTDYVFDGSNRIPLKEEHVKNPLNHYAQSKLAGEKILSKANCSNTTFRISWLFSPFGNNFVKKILKLSNVKKKIKVVNDQLGSPTYGIDLARVVLDNFTNPRFFDFGCYHFTNKGGISWFEFAKKIIEISLVMELEEKKLDGLTMKN